MPYKKPSKEARLFKSQIYDFTLKLVVKLTSNRRFDAPGARGECQIVDLFVWSYTLCCLLFTYAVGIFFKVALKSYFRKNKQAQLEKIHSQG